MLTGSEALLVGFDEEMDSTRKLLACLPNQNFDFKPHPKSMPLDRLAGHIAEMPRWASDVLEHNSFNLKPAEGERQRVADRVNSREEALSTFDGLREEAQRLLRGARDEQLAENWALMFGKHVVFSRPRSEVLRIWFFNHLIHHRAQLGVYLRLLDIPIPGMYGPSADTREQMIAEFQQRA